MSYSRQKLFSNREVAHLLRSVAAAYLIKNANRFRIIAYDNAADTIERMTRELKDVWQEGNLDKVPGIGQSIASYLDEYFEKGFSKHFDQVLRNIPETVFELMKVPTIGPKKAYKLVREFGLKNKETVVSDLKKLCLSGKIAKLPTFGEKSQEAILEALNLYEKRAKTTDRMPLPYAHSLATEVIDYLKKNSYLKRADALGSLRRMVVTIGDIDIAVATEEKHATKIVEHFLKYPRKVRVDNAGSKKASIIVSPQVRIDLRVQNEKNYGPMLQYFTGSKSHNIQLREYALKKGYSLSEYGVKQLKTGKIREFKTEEEFYRSLGMQYIPPEIREGTNEIEIALKHKIPKLVEISDIKGDLHIHSNYDLKPSHDFGENSFLEICQKAMALKYEYVGFTEHNPRIGNLSSGEIVKIMKKRKSNIGKTLKKKLKQNFRFFIGLEVDILPNGRIALPQEAAKYVDYLVIAIHSVFGMDIKTMTRRVLEALKNPKVKVLGHPTGRLLGKREGFELEWEKIFEYCKKSNIALEINAWPERLDLPDTLVRQAVDKGLKLIINTDAHANSQMDNMFYGVSVARRGWATKNDIMNASGQKVFAKWLLEGVIK